MKKLLFSLAILLGITSFSYAAYFSDSHYVVSTRDQYGNWTQVGYGTPSNRQYYYFGQDKYATFFLSADAWTNGSTGCQATSIAKIYNDGVEVVRAYADGYNKTQEVRDCRYFTGYADYLYINLNLSAWMGHFASGNAIISW